MKPKEKENFTSPLYRRLTTFSFCCVIILLTLSASLKCFIAVVVVVVVAVAACSKGQCRPADDDSLPFLTVCDVTCTKGALLTRGKLHQPRFRFSLLLCFFSRRCYFCSRKQSGRHSVVTRNNSTKTKAQHTYCRHLGTANSVCGQPRCSANVVVLQSTSL